MSTIDPPPHEREEPPFVHAFIVGGIQRAGSGLRTIVRSINQRVLMWCGGLGVVAIFLLTLIASVVSSPTVVGVLQGLFVGAFVALLFALGFLSLLLWARETPKKGVLETSARASELDARLAPALRELNALRADIINQVKTRSMTRVPIGTVGGVIAWVLAQRGNDPPGFLELIIFAVVGAAAGEYWAAYKLERQYRRRYKDRVLPQIAGGPRKPHLPASRDGRR